MTVPEDNILKPLVKPKNPLPSNSDDWPIFYLKKVKVVSQDNGEPVSLLSARKGYPVRVTGQLLEIEDDYKHLVRDPNYKKQLIELTNVDNYAFGEYVDGTSSFWAAGNAGWFEFDSVAASYRSVYNQMSEATSLIFVLADRIKKQKSKMPASMDGSRLERYMQSVFSDYLSKAGNPARFSDVEDVREAFHEHRSFLITSMLESQEDVYWLDQPIFTYFKRRFPEDVSDLTARIIPGSVLSAAGATEIEVGPMQETKKRGSESPHLKEPRTKKKMARPSKEFTTMQLETPPLNSPTEGSIPAEDDDDPVVITRKRKSFLRLSGATSAKKAKIASSSLEISSKLDADDDSDDETEEDSTSAAHEPTVTTLKNGEHLNLVTNPRSHSSDHGSRDRSSPPHFLPLKYLELNVTEYDIPSTKPQGPGDLWTCSFEGCHTRVHQAATDSGQERVKEHLKTHIVKEKIDLVIDESRPYLPVNNLVRRLQAFAPPSGEGLASDSIERTFSAPIRRRY